MSPFMSKLVTAAGVRIVPDDSGKTWSLWQRASASGKRRLCVNWSSKFESRFFGLAAEDPVDGIPESNFPSKDILFVEF